MLKRRGAETLDVISDDSEEDSDFDDDEVSS